MKDKKIQSFITEHCYRCPYFEEGSLHNPSSQCAEKLCVYIYWYYRHYWLAHKRLELTCKCLFPSNSEYFQLVLSCASNFMPFKEYYTLTPCKVLEGTVASVCVYMHRNIFNLSYAGNCMIIIGSGCDSCSRLHRWMVVHSSECLKQQLDCCISLCRQMKVRN